MRIIPYRLALPVCLIVLPALTGCKMTSDGKAVLPHWLRPADYADPTDDETIPAWHGQAGTEGRHGQAREKAGNEPQWWRNLWASEKAQDIERNCGFD